MFFRWWRDRRRKRQRSQALPDVWRDALGRNLRVYGQLTDPERSKLEGDLQILVAEKNWEGCGGLQLTDEMRVTIAGQASMLILAWEDEYFDRVQSILVYPGPYVARDRTDAPGGVVLEGTSEREGEAWYRGPVILSWPDALAGARGESHGHNLILHEFAHQLDMQCGAANDGVPCLQSGADVRRWQEVMSREYRRLSRDCDRGRLTLLDCYGTTDEAEFFAVATECFFERPAAMRQKHSSLYEILSSFYRQNPAERCGSPPTEFLR